VVKKEESVDLLAVSVALQLASTTVCRVSKKEASEQMQEMSKPHEPDARLELAAET
jgi:hypothetical protein